jgi:hypothetical protein
VPGDSGFYVETTDNSNEQSDDATNGNGGPFSLVVTLTNAGVSLTQSLTLYITADCTIETVTEGATPADVAYQIYGAA